VRETGFLFASGIFLATVSPECHRILRMFDVTVREVLNHSLLPNVCIIADAGLKVSRAFCLPSLELGAREGRLLSELVKELLKAEFWVVIGK